MENLDLAVKMVSKENKDRQDQEESPAHRDLKVHLDHRDHKDQEEKMAREANLDLRDHRDLKDLRVGLHICCFVYIILS